MGLIEDIMDTLSGADDVAHPHLIQALQGLAGNEEEPGPGLQGLLAHLQAVGLGGIVASWLGGETNLPVSPDQLREALGDTEVEATARRAGMAPDAMLTTLSEHLPGLIDRLSPAGQLLPAGAGATARE